MKGKCRVMFFLVGVLLLCVISVEGSNGWGIGVILGEPTGISLKFWNGRTIAIDAALAWSFKQEDRFHLHMDWLFHNFNLLKVEEGKLPIYLGIGGRVKFTDETRVGVRFPVGVCFIPQDIPIDVFLEIVPILDLAPETRFDINASIGIRYFFK
jgi:hypothetical protein